MQKQLDICISKPWNNSLSYSEKNCRRGACGRGGTISRMLKDFAAKVDTTFFVKLWFVSNIKMTFTLTAVVKMNGSKIEFCGLFMVREVFVSRTVGTKNITHHLFDLTTDFFNFLKRMNAVNWRLIVLFQYQFKQNSHFVLVAIYQINMKSSL
jgi:hypothetical protein